MEFNRNVVDCAIIKVDITRPGSTYERDGSATSYGYNYSVRIKDIEESVNFIKAAYEEFGIPCSRIYLSGFALLTESSIWTKQKIVDSIKYESNRIKMIEQENKVFSKKK